MSGMPPVLVKNISLLAATGKKAFFLLLFFSSILHLAGYAQSRTSAKKNPPKRGSKIIQASSRKKPSAKATKAPIKNTILQPLSEVRTLLERERITLAKNAIEGYFRQPKFPKTAEAWYVKGKVFSAVSAHPKTHKLHPEARKIALEAFRKSLETDKSQSFLQFTLDNFKPVFTLYTDGLQKGVDYYNTGMFDAALVSFQEAAMAGNFIYSQGWGLSRLDTTLTYYAGLASYKLGNTEGCAQYFRQLADGSIAVDEGYGVIYRFLARYAFDQKNEASLKRYIRQGFTLFPYDEYFSLLDLEWSRDRRDFNTLFDKYEQMLTRSLGSYDLKMDYVNDLFEYLFASGENIMPGNYELRSGRAETLSLQLVKSYPESVEAWMSLGKFYYNQMVRHEQTREAPGANFSELQITKSKGLPPSLIFADKGIEALQNVLLLLDGLEEKKQEVKGLYQSACSLISFCYEIKKDTERADQFRKMHASKNPSTKQ